MPCIAAILKSCVEVHRCLLDVIMLAVTRETLSEEEWQELHAALFVAETYGHDILTAFEKNKILPSTNGS
jgi:hypothetical protein